MGRDEAGIPRTPEAFGAELQRLRENAGVSLEDIVAETKIGLGVLRDLEAGRFSRLPERVFTRNFVRQFGEAVGVAPETLVAWFDVAWEAYTLRSGSHPAIALAETPAPRVGKRLWTWIPVALGVVVLVAVLLALLLRDRDADGATGAMTPAAAEATMVPESSPPPASPSPMVSSPVPAVTAESGEPVVATVRVLPGNECWIRSRDEHGQVSQRLLREGERVEIPVRKMVQLTLGNGGGVVLTVGDETYRTPGRPGEVVHLEVRPDGISRQDEGDGGEVGGER